MNPAADLAALKQRLQGINDLHGGIRADGHDVRVQGLLRVLILQHEAEAVVEIKLPRQTREGIVAPAALVRVRHVDRECNRQHLAPRTKMLHLA